MDNVYAHLWASTVFFKKPKMALAGVAQWIECQPANQRVVGLIPSQDTCLGCGPGPQWGACRKQPHNDISLHLIFPSPLSKNNYIKILKKHI